MRKPILLWSLVLAGLALTPEARRQIPGPLGRPIVSVDFQPPDQPFPSEDLIKLLPLHPGSPLKTEDVREAIRKLYATGRYSDISISSHPQQSGVAIEIEPPRILHERRYSGRGIGTAEQSATGGVYQAGAGCAFQDDMAPAVENMQERLKANGFYNARIMTDVTHEESTEEANIKFTVTTGDRARFAGVTFSGSSPRQKKLDSLHWLAPSLRFRSVTWMASGNREPGSDRRREDTQDISKFGPPEGRRNAGRPEV